MDTLQLQQEYIRLFDASKKVMAELNKHYVIAELEFSGKGFSKLSQLISFNEDIYTLGKKIGMEFIKQTLEIEKLNHEILIKSESSRKIMNEIIEFYEKEQNNLKKNYKEIASLIKMNSLLKFPPE